MNGTDGSIGIGVEGTWGTGVAPTAFFNAKENITEDRGRLRDDFTFGSRALQPADAGRLRLSGGISDMAVRPAYIGHLLKATIGQPVSVGGPNYTHTFTPQAGGVNVLHPLPPYSMTVRKGTKTLRYTGGQCGKLELSQAKDGILKVGTDWIFRNVGVVGAPVTVLENAERFRYRHLTVRRAAVAFPFVEDLKISIDNSLATEEVFDGTDTVSAIDFDGVMKCEVGMTITFRNQDTYNDFVANNSAAWEFDWLINANTRLQINMPRLNIEKYSDPISGPGRMTISVTAMAELDSVTGYDVRAILSNNIINY
jgi:hypothetical protein